MCLIVKFSSMSPAPLERRDKHTMAKKSTHQRTSRRRSTCHRVPLVAGEVAALEHELGDDAVEPRAGVAVPVLPSAQLAEVGAGSWGRRRRTA